jgi:hypothetical protein
VTVRELAARIPSHADGPAAVVVPAAAPDFAETFPAASYAATE